MQRRFAPVVVLALAVLAWLVPASAQAALPTPIAGWPTTAVSDSAPYVISTPVWLRRGTTPLTGRAVQLQRRATNSTTWSQVSSGTTNANGAWIATYTVSAGSWSYRIVAPAVAGYDQGVTPERAVTGTTTPVVLSVSPGAGRISGGSRVVITGKNLAGATRVLFGSAAGTSLTALPWRWLAGRDALSVVAPAGVAGSVDVRVVTAAGTSPITSADRFTYDAATPALTQVATGDQHSCALTSTGGVGCWGYNANGQLGTGGTTASATPAQVSGLASGVTQVVTGADHSCALLTGGTVRCWGAGGDGQLGVGSTDDAALPTAIPGLSGITSIAAGGNTTCAVTATGGVLCWGANEFGQVGNPAPQDPTRPTDVIALTGGVRSVTVGRTHACALTTAGAVSCWGLNTSGELGRGGTVTGGPAPVAGLPVIASITAGTATTCAVSTAGSVLCWGANYSGQLGRGTTGSGAFPTPGVVSGLGGPATSVSAGDGRVCATASSGAARCWGSGDHGALGTGTAVSVAAIPTTPLGLGSGVRSVSAGGGQVCAVTTSAGALCWGENAFGQLGAGPGPMGGTGEPRLIPAPVSITGS